jgi:hypothetical protein
MTVILDSEITDHLSVPGDRRGMVSVTRAWSDNPSLSEYHL